jgi:acyl transferase domain-containing protein/acyl carrier protein
MDMENERRPVLSGEEEIEAWLIERLSRRLGVDPGSIDVRERFSRQGLDSLGATELLAALGTKLGRTLPVTLVWEHPTPEALARFLVFGAAEPPVVAHRSLRANDEPIAVVGVACRFPNAADPDAFWRLLRDGIDAITEMPPGRWDTAALFDPEISAPGKMTTRWGGYLDQIDRFEPSFFGISPRETVQMDPQQRVMLELSWEALEDAGIAPPGLKGSRTGVFFGAMWSDYARLPAGSFDAISPHTATGQDLSIIPARVSYTLGLRGPSLAVNTACSSSLVAVHLACDSLRRGESTLVLAGGVNLILAPESTIAMSKFGAMAPDGRSKAFDARANGYVRGEGAGVVVLKPLSDALRSGDPIYCVIRGSAMNNDGFSNGLTAPSPQAQEAVLRDAYANAGVPPSAVHYVEAHGTGTFLGDPIEAKALGVVLGEGRAAGRPLRLGSVKTNIGHPEAAAGIAGLLKVALAMQHRQIPRSLHFERPNPNIPFEALHLEVQRSLAEWPEPGAPALAGVSSFGFGGTNCHVVLESLSSGPAHLLALSAPCAEALEAAARELLAATGAGAPGSSLAALCTASTGRWSHGEHRLALTVRSHEELAERLEGFLGGQRHPGTSAGRADVARRKLAYVFAGQGSQWLGMGRSLLAEEPVFRAAIERCDEAMRPYVRGSLLDALCARDARLLEESDFVQPAIFAIQVALAALWTSWGIAPDAVVGQSMGEVAAACVAGILSVDDAARVICCRSRIVKRMSGRGAMAAVELSLGDAEHALAGREDRVSVAVSTSPSSTVLSGDTAALEEVLSALEGRGVICRRIKVDYASHSPHMDGLRDELLHALQGIRPRPSAVPFYSTVTGAPLDGAQLDEAYWARNLREPVLFFRAVERLADDGHDVFLDVDPHPLLAHPVEQCLAHLGRDGAVLASMRRDEPGRAVLLDSLGALYVRGARVRWDRVEPGEAEPVSLAAIDALSGRVAKVTTPESAELLVLSAHRPEALRESARALAAWLTGRRDIPLGDLCFTSSVRRSHHEHRLAVVGSSREEMVRSLEALARGEAPAGTVQGKAKSGSRPRVVFVLSGQGSQWAGMGGSLLQQEPVFRAAIEACDRLLAPLAGWSLLEQLTAPEATSRLHETEVAQPALFAMQFALAELWRSWGITADAVIGHSVGEVAAAQIAGALSLEEAVRIVHHRGRLMQRATGMGKMAWVDMPAEEMTRLLEAHADRLSIAAINDPGSVVLSGDALALDEVLEELRRDRVHCRELAVSCAFHSPQMAPFQGELASALGHIELRPTALAMYSTVTGERIGGEALDAAYWARNIREPVQLARAVGAASAEDHRIFLELAPHAVLSANLQRCLSERDDGRLVVATLRRGRDGRRSLLQSLAALHAAGYPVEWKRLYPAGGRCVSLPPYPWQRERYWLDLSGEAPRAHARQDGAGAEIQELLYAVEWRAQPLQPAARPAASGHWVVLLDDGGVGERVAEALEAAGGTCSRVPLGGAGERSRGEAAPVDPTSPESLDVWLSELSATHGPVRGIVHLWSLCGARQAEGGLDSALRRGVHSALAWVQAVLRTGREHRPKLWFVTRGAHSVGPGEPVTAPEQAPLWGLGRVVSLEHPEIWGGLIDMPSAIHEDATSQLVAQLLASDPDDHVALRASGRFVQRLVRGRPPRRAAKPWTTSGTALITGGLGAIGLHVARWLARRGAAHLVLTSRNGAFTEAAAQAVASLEALGAAVTVAQVDVADAPAMAAMLADIEARLPPLTAVFHAAGVVDHTPLPGLDDARLSQILRPKVHGTSVLDALTRDRPLDAFVCFSSIASVWGSGRQASYAAANAFQDALVEARRAAGAPALGVNWGPWRDGGMTTPDVLAALEQRGVRALLPDEAIAALELLLGSQAEQAIVADVDWPRFCSIYETGGARPLVSEMPHATEAAAGAAEAGFPEELKTAPVRERRRMIQRRLQELVAQTLGFDAPESVDPTKGFFDLGMDSLMTVALRSRVQQVFGLLLPSSSTFNHPSVVALTAFLVDELSLGEEVEAAESAAVGPAHVEGGLREPIAIVGLGCRLPGGVEDPEDLWRLLATGVDAVSEIPNDRWDAAAYYDPDPDAAGRTYVRQGAFLSTPPDLFDARFFGISPREAVNLDPQHRLLLEVIWEAMEHAGVVPGADPQTGVFVGIGMSDYSVLQRASVDLDALDAYTLSGTFTSFAAGRLSYALELNGPSMSVDTACSSSLVAIHLACQSLRAGECRTAVAGGVALMLSPMMHVYLSRIRALAPDGRCKTFSADANGYGRGEGCGMIVLKRLSDARRDGDRVLAVIRGSAVNSDGHSSGITVPNGQAQQAVVRKALENARLSPSDVDYVEAHGTGTSLGDPIEIEALAAVYGPGRPRGRPLRVGSVVKTNVGHLEAAAGVAGVMKVVLALQHGELPAHLHAQTLNPRISWAQLPVTVPTAAEAWRPGARLRRAGVSAFGMSGTNAHMVLEEAPQEVDRTPAPDGSLSVLPLSAKSPDALRALAQAYRSFLSKAVPGAPRLADIAYTASVRRRHHECRLALVGGSRDELTAALDAFLRGEAPPGAAHGRAAPGAQPRVIFVFPGQGSQRVGMGRQLLEQEPVFRAALEACDTAIRRETGWSLLEELGADEERSRLSELSVVQPALFAMEVALSALWRSWGVEPDAVVGHSMGEIAAAHVAGALTLEDAAGVVCRRSRLLERLSGKGEMALVELPLQEAQQALHGYESRVSVAVSNSPRSTVLSGDPGALEEILSKLEREQVFCRRVKVDFASHSPQVDPILGELRAALAGVAPAAARVPMFSTVTGQPCHGEELTADYWAHNLRDPAADRGRTRAVRRDEPAPDPGAGDRGAAARRRAGGRGARVAAEKAGRAARAPRVARRPVRARLSCRLEAAVSGGCPLRALAGVSVAEGTVLAREQRPAGRLAQEREKVARRARRSLGESSCTPSTGSVAISRRRRRQRPRRAAAGCC